jgi:hypothetical protein
MLAKFLERRLDRIGAVVGQPIAFLPVVAQVVFQPTFLLRR